MSLYQFEGLARVPVTEASAGNIIAMSGIGDITIGDTICAAGLSEPLPFVKISAPTMEMTFSVNDSPFAGREGKYVTSRNLRDRLMRETLKDVSLRVSDTDSTEAFNVAGRGEMHLSILIETMRREGYEFQVSPPRVLYRGLFGYRSEFMTDTRGEGIMASVFDSYAPFKGDLSRRSSGSLIAFETGDSVTYGLWAAQERGALFIGPGVPVYGGMVVGETPKSEDITVNVCRKKQLTNMRASGSDESLRLVPPRNMSLEQCLEFLADDELLEVTPENLRLRKRILNHEIRMKALKGNKKYQDL